MSSSESCLGRITSTTNNFVATLRAKRLATTNAYLNRKDAQGEIFGLSGRLM
jgi:hypothetical protein